jgi:hypothetical protein
MTDGDEIVYCIVNDGFGTLPIWYIELNLIFCELIIILFHLISK